MSQSEWIVVAIVAGFLVYLASKQRLGAYWSLLVGGGTPAAAKAAPANAAGAVAGGFLGGQPGAGGTSSGTSSGASSPAPSPAQLMPSPFSIMSGRWFLDMIQPLIGGH